MRNARRVTGAGRALDRRVPVSNCCSRLKMSPMPACPPNSKASGPRTSRARRCAARKPMSASQGPFPPAAEKSRTMRWRQSVERTAITASGTTHRPAKSWAAARGIGRSERARRESATPVHSASEISASNIALTSTPAPPSRAAPLMTRYRGTGRTTKQLVPCTIVPEEPQKTHTAEACQWQPASSLLTIVGRSEKMRAECRLAKQIDSGCRLHSDETCQ